MMFTMTVDMADNGYFEFSTESLFKLTKVAMLMSDFDVITEEDEEDEEDEGFEIPEEIAQYFTEDEEYTYDEDSDCFFWYDEEHDAWYWLNVDTGEWLRWEEDDYELKVA